MTGRVAYILNALRSQLALSPVLTGLGVLGVAAGGLCIAGALIWGVAVQPEGNLIETATFNGSVGIFILTLAILLPGVEWTRKGRRAWTGTMVVMIVYAYGIETVQALRGLDPRFSSVAGPLDQALGGIFFLSAVVIMGLFAVLAVKYFRAPSTPVVVAVRYGGAACFIAFGIGILMSAISTRQVGEAGNLLVLHAAGFHGIQAVPFVALLLQWARADRSITGPLVHLAGLTWLGACLALGWQSGTGGSVGAISPATVLALLCLLTFAMTVVLAARAWMFSGGYGASTGNATA